MLFEELQARTNPPATYEEYEVINAAYSASLDTNQPMSHEDAARMWNTQYGAPRRRQERELRRQREALIAEILFEGYGQFFHDRPDTVRNAIHRAEQGIRQARNNDPWCRRFTDELGIIWEVVSVGRTPNGFWEILELHIVERTAHQTTLRPVHYTFY